MQVFAFWGIIKLSEKAIERRDDMKRFIAVFAVLIVATVLYQTAVYFWLPDGSVDLSGAVSQGEQEPKTPLPEDSFEYTQLDMSAAQGSDHVASVTDQTAPPSFYYEFWEPQDGYNALQGTELQALYHQIESSVYQIGDEKNDRDCYPMKTITVRGTHIDKADIRRAITAFTSDSPQVFWMSNVYGFAYSGEDTVIQLYSYLSADACTQAIKQLNAKIEEIISSMAGDISELNREIYLFEQLAKDCFYDDAAAQNTDIWQSYTSYGALVNGRAVCEGYSRAMQLLLSYAGIHSRIVYGEADGGLHMWNLVRIDGEWYHLDAAWNDSNTLVSYRYFNVTDQVIQKDHTISGNLSALPECTSEAAGYYQAKGVKITGFDGGADKTVIDALVQAAEKEARQISFYVDPFLDYDEIIKGLFSQEPYKLAYYIGQANKQLETKLDYQAMIYVLSEENRGITVKLEYEI